MEQLKEVREGELMKDIDLIKLKELALSASSGCWHQETEHECPWNVVDENGIQVAIMQQRTTIRDNPKQTDRAANAAFIAGANPAVILTLIEQLEAAQRERDEASERLALVREQRDAEINRNTELEAELKRRDEQEPVAWQYYSESVGGWVETSAPSHWEKLNFPVRPLYTAAPAAVLAQDPVTQAVSDAVAERTAAVRIVLDEESCKLVGDAIANPDQPNARIVRAAGRASAFKGEQS